MLYYESRRFTIMNHLEELYLKSLSSFSSIEELQNVKSSILSIEKLYKNKILL